jgi:hypothetical protein
VDENGNGARNRNACAYKVPKSLLTFLELAFAVYYFVAVLIAIYIRKWASVPFIWLFFSGFAYISVMSMADVRIFRRLALKELKEEIPVIPAAQ